MKELELLLKNIKNKTFQPVYFLAGEEPFYIDLLVKRFENDVLEDDEKAFNQTVAYGKDTSYGEVLSLARQFPMMGDRQLIIIKEAQEMSHDEVQSQAFEKYLENPVPSTILVIAYKHKKLDKRKKFVKMLEKNQSLFSSEKIKEYNVSKWIEKQAGDMGLNFSPKIAALLSDHLGTDLSRIFNELEKVKLILQAGEELDENFVEKHIGISKEFNVFELQKALGAKDAARSFRIAHYMGKSKSHALPATLAALFKFFSSIIIYHTMRGQPEPAITAAMGISPFFLKDYTIAAANFPLKQATKVISVLREMDVKSKGLGSRNLDDGDILKEMVYKILMSQSLQLKN